MKTKFFLIALLIVTQNIYAQTPTWEWAQGSIGTMSGDNGGGKVKIGKSGDVYVIGDFLGDSVTFGSITLYRQSLLTTGGIDNFFILKYNASGNLLLAKNLAIGSFSGFGFDLDDLDNIYISGYFSLDSVIIGTTTIYNKGDETAFLAKFDSLGNSIWVKSNSKGGYLYTRSVNVDVSGNIYLFGACTSSDTLNFDPITVILNDSISYLFITKFNPSGTPIWIKCFGANKQGVMRAGGVDANDITTDALGNIFITGSFSAPYLLFDTITIYNDHPPGWWDDIFLVKLDSSGNALWAKSQGGHNQNGDAGWCVNVDAIGNVNMAGYFTPNSTFDSVSITGVGAFLAQYNPNGKLNWIKAIKGGAYIWGLSVDAFGNKFVVGYFTGDSIWIDSITIQNTHSLYMTHPGCIIVAKFDSLGHMPWIINGIGAGYGAGIDADIYGNIYIVGSYEWDSLILGSNILLSNISLGTTFVAKLSNVTGISEVNEKYQNILVIYPNPLTSSSTLQFNTQLKDAEVVIYDIVGKEMLRKKLTGDRMEIEKGSLERGVFFVKVISEEGQWVEKMVVE